MADISFKTNVFVQNVGLTAKSDTQLLKIFEFLDTDNDGDIVEEDLRPFLQIFNVGARLLTAAETADFMKAGDPNNTGKISSAGFIAMVRAAKHQN
ncbi:parvalbumin beta-like [Ranitomeya variabilis]|uniref:parvalbumin beta-like n=1 Tax=Ranitomeya variabilis TaxID=490064 RepID=UPI004055B196